jgi:V/A-type H+/Na+-transporting ATPase subunit E
MEEQLESLLNRIRSEGVERAEAEAAAIIEQAEERARHIVRDAEAQAEALRRKAEDDSAASVRRGEQALEQAARDFLLALQHSVEAVLRETLCETVAAALTPETMSEMLLRLADAYAAHDMNENRVDVLLSPEDRDDVGALVMEKYRELVRQGLTLRPDERIEAGFKVSFVDSHLYHDFSAEALAEALAPVLKPPLCDMVRRAAEEQA